MERKWNLCSLDIRQFVMDFPWIISSNLSRIDDMARQFVLSVREKKDKRISISQGIRQFGNRVFEEHFTLWQDNNSLILTFVQNGTNQQFKDHCNSNEMYLPAYTVTHRLQVKRNLPIKDLCRGSLSL